jgi:hypothetical protein
MRNISEKSLKYLILFGIGMGGMYFSILIFNSLGYWYGGKLLLDHELSYGKPYSILSVYVILNVICFSF